MELQLETPYRGSRLAKFTVNTSPAWIAVIDIDPCRYWLWQTKGSTAIAASCEQGGVSDPNPA